MLFTLIVGIVFAHRSLTENQSFTINNLANKNNFF